MDCAGRNSALLTLRAMAIKCFINSGQITLKDSLKDKAQVFDNQTSLTAEAHASNASNLNIRVGTSANDADDIFVYVDIAYTKFTDEGGTALGASRNATVTALQAIFDSTLNLNTFVEGDTSAGSTGTTKLRHIKASSGADRDQAGTLELDTHSASIGLYDSYLKISETDLSNTGGKTAAYGDFRLDLQNASGSAATAMRISMGNVYSQAVGIFSFATLNISGNTTFSSSSGTVTFDGDTSGIDYGDLANVPTTFAPASHNHAASEITSGTFSTARIPGLGSSKITSGTFANARISQSSVTQHQAALTITESQISDLAHYTDASVNTHLNQSGASSGQYLKWTGSDYAWGTISSGGLGNVVEDTSPQLGGPLDVNGEIITSASNGDVVIDPAGTGAIVLRSDDIQFEGAGTLTMSSLKFHEASALGSNYVALKAPLSVTNDVTWTLPAADGTSGQVIKTDGSGALSFTTVVSTVNPVMQGTASIQPVAGLPAGLKIFDDDNSHGVRFLAPDLTADVDFTLPATDGSSGQVLKTDGSGNLSFVAQTADTNTNLGNTDMTLSGSRIITMSNDLNFKVGSSSKLLYDVSANSGSGKWTFSAVTQFLNDVEFHGAGGTTQASIKFNEPSQGGSNGVVLQGPSTNMTSDLTFTLPDTDGSAGQFLKTDGSGNLSFASGGSGGGGGDNFLGQFGGMFSWGSADDGERVGLHTTYGPYFYSTSTEPDQSALKNYDASQAVDSATSTMDNYKIMMMGFQVPTTNKKIKCVYGFRVQSAPSGSTWGISLWGGSLDTSGSANSERTVTLRAKTADITVSSTSTVVYHGEFTTTSAINAGSIIPFVENRTGALSTTTRVYGSFKLYLVD